MKTFFFSSPWVSDVLLVGDFVLIHDILAFVAVGCTSLDDGGKYFIQYVAQDASRNVIPCAAIDASSRNRGSNLTPETAEATATTSPSLSTSSTATAAANNNAHNHHSHNEEQQRFPLLFTNLVYKCHDLLMPLPQLGADATVNVMGLSPKDAAARVVAGDGDDQGQRPDVCVDCCGFESSVATALAAAKSGGRVCLVGMVRIAPIAITVTNHAYNAVLCAHANVVSDIDKRVGKSEEILWSTFFPPLALFLSLPSLDP